MTLGTNNKKSVIALAVLGAGAAVSVYVNFLSGPDIPSSSRSASPAAAPAESPSTMPVAAVSGSAGPKMSPRTRNRSEEFHPALRSKKGDQPVDYTKVDPMIRVDLFKKVQAVEMAAAVGKRNLFQFGAPPAPPAPTPTDAQPIVKPKLIYDRPLAPPPPPQPVKQVEAPPPPIPLKYYAFWVSMDTGRRTACFLADKEEILMAAEGETVKARYKVIRINPTSVVMEDLNVKKQQTLQLAEEAPVQGE